MSTRHVVLTDSEGRPTGRARIDLDECIGDHTDQNRQGWMLYRTKRGRVIARNRSQWANVADHWTAEPMEVAEIMAKEGWDLDDEDKSVIAALEEV